MRREDAAISGWPGAGALRLVVLALAVALAGCATPYQSSGALGGYKEARLKDDVWRVSFAGNGHTSYESVQTYWLYRCAELALEQGFDGFEILSDVRFVRSAPLDAVGIRGDFRRTLVARSSTPIFIPMPIGPARYGHTLAADIRLLRKPFERLPPKILDAAVLKAALEKYVRGDLCDGNVCPHLHEYILPPGKLGS